MIGEIRHVCFAAWLDLKSSLLLVPEERLQGDDLGSSKRGALWCVVKGQQSGPCKGLIS